VPLDDTPCNTPQAGYYEGLESYMFKPIREKIIQILKESKNSTTGNMWFKHISKYFEQPRDVLSDAYFPCVFVLTPRTSIVPHGMNQLALSLTIQIEYYCKHYKENVTNELEHFVERLLYIIQTNSSIPFGKVYGTKQLCIKQWGYNEENIEFDFNVEGSHIVRAVVVSTTARVPLLMIEPP